LPGKVCAAALVVITRDNNAEYRRRKFIREVYLI